MGFIWSSEAHGQASPDIRDALYVPDFGGVILGVGPSGPDVDQIIRSVDGVNWTSHTLPEMAAWSGLAYSPSLGRIIACNGNSTDKFAKSDDGGATWTLASTSPSFSASCICWSPDLDLFVTGSNAASTTSRFRTSPDGVTWTTITGTPNRIVVSVIWVSELGLFVAALYHGSTSDQNVMTSPDGTTWTVQTTVPGLIESPPASFGTSHLAWSPTFQRLYMTTEDGSVMTSTDAITWTQMTLPVDGDIGFFQFGCHEIDGQMMFVAEDDGATTKAIMVSTDGTTLSLLPPTLQAGEWSHPRYMTNVEKVVVFSRFDSVVLLGASDELQITDVDPGSGDIAGGYQVEIIGANFPEDDVEVVFDKRLATDVIWNSATSLTVTVPGRPEGIGVVDVTVTQVSTGVFDTGADLFEYIEADGPGPVITCGSISPTSGVIAGGTSVSIVGSGFETGDLVFFGDTAAEDVVVVNPNLITCTSPPHQVEVVDIIVREP